MNKLTPLLSIIIPVYQTAAFLNECLDSIFRTVSSEFEVIALEDHGGDDSWQILCSIANGEPRLRCFQQPLERKGLSEARNLGIEFANGKYLFFVDSDDSLESNHLEELLAALRSVGDRDIFRVGFKFTWAERPYSVCQRCADFSGLTGLDAARVLDEVGAFDPLAQLHVVRRQFVLDHGIRFLPGIVHEDNLFSFELFWHARVVDSRSIFIYRYLQREGSLSKIKTLKHLLSVVEIIGSMLGKVATTREQANFLAKSIAYQRNFNFKANLLSLPSNARQTFWKTIAQNHRYDQTVRSTFPSWATRFLLRLSPRLCFKLIGLSRRFHHR